MVSDWIAALETRLIEQVGRGATLVVAVSGGGDSVALLHALARLREPLDLTLVVGHLDHALRPESGEDAAFVGRLAQALALFCAREQRDIGALAAAEGGNVEEIARRERYAMLDALARATGAAAVVVAHTLDDQAETVLMRLLRGSGLDGLKGMRERSPSPAPGAVTPLLRPLLDVRRATLRQWLQDEQIAWREDATNDEPSGFRARLRNVVIPQLEAERPDLQEALARSAALLQTDHDFLREAAATAYAALTERLDAGILVDREGLRSLHPALKARVLRRAFFEIAPPGSELRADQVAHVLAVAQSGEVNAQATLGAGLRLKVLRRGALVGPEGLELPALAIERPIDLPLSGAVQSQGLHVTLTEVGREALPTRWKAQPTHVALIDLAEVQLPLSLRPPTPKERWTPLGMAGQEVAVRGWLAKHEVPAAARAHAPLLVDGAQQVLWIVGGAVSERARVRDSSQRLLRVEVRELSDTESPL